MTYQARQRQEEMLLIQPTPLLSKQIKQRIEQEATAARDFTAFNSMQRAWKYLTTPTVPRSFDESTGTLTILSPQSGETYIVTPDACRCSDGGLCPAFADNKTCWHRQARRFLVLLVDACKQPPPSAALCAPNSPEPPQSPTPRALICPELPSPDEQGKLLIIAPAILDLSRSIALHRDGVVVGHAQTSAEAEQWWSREETLLFTANE